MENKKPVKTKGGCIAMAVLAFLLGIFLMLYGFANITAGMTAVILMLLGVFLIINGVIWLKNAQIIEKNK